MSRFSLVVALLLGACSAKPEPPEPLTEVKVIQDYQVGSTGKPWYQDCISSWAIYERTDTHERVTSTNRLGKPGDVFKVRWSELMKQDW